MFFELVLGIILLCLGSRNVLSLSSLDKTSSETASRELVIAAYLPDYRFGTDVNAVALHVTDLILFSVSPESNGSIGLGAPPTCCLSKSHYEAARAAREFKRSYCQQPTWKSCVGAGGDKLRLIVSIGGGGRSQNIANLVANDDSRSRFVGEILELCTREKLDGVDFDWEQPRDQQEYIGYMTLIAETWAAFQQSPLQLIVTVALHPNQYLPSAVYPYIDRVHVMAYDMITPSAHGGGYLHHARFDKAKEVIESFVERGCPRSKLVLGMPAYGRHAHDPGRVATYSEAVSELDHVNELQDLHTRNEFHGYLFDSPADVRSKVKWAAGANLAGVFFWEAGQDKIFEASTGAMGLLQSAADEASQLLSHLAGFEVESAEYPKSRAEL